MPLQLTLTAAVSSQSSEGVNTWQFTLLCSALELCVAVSTGDLDTYGKLGNFKWDAAVVHNYVLLLSVLVLWAFKYDV